MIVDMLEYYDMIKRFNIDIIYSGPLWAGEIESIASTLKRRMEFDELPLSESQAVFSVFVEQMNNMLMYSVEKHSFDDSAGAYSEKSKGVFILGIKDKTYFVQTGNVMKAENTGMIKERIDYLNTLDKAHLRKLYKEQIKSVNDSAESKGARLGLIEIAKRASSKIEYSFTPLDESLSFFSMFVTIGQGRG